MAASVLTVFGMRLKEICMIMARSSLTRAEVQPLVNTTVARNG